MISKMATNGFHISPDDEPSSAKRLMKRDVPPKRISHIQFSTLSPEEMQRLAEFQVCSRELFSMPSRRPAPSGCLDPRLGVSDKTSVCATCKLKLVDCAGHFGYIRLALPVFHIGFLKHTLNLLQCVCKTCSRVLLEEEEKEKTLRHFRNPHIDALGKTSLFKKVLEKCKKVKECPSCGATNGAVKKITGAPTLRIVHERYKLKNQEEEMEALYENLQTAIQYNKDIESALTGSPPAEDLLPTRVQELFSHIPDEDCELLWMDPLIGRPENLILENILVRTMLTTSLMASR
jgi:DNA-directed RNA polymerase III subunit RPC1